jgi:hypothetical protein
MLSFHQLAGKDEVSWHNLNLDDSCLLVHAGCEQWGAQGLRVGPTLSVSPATCCLHDEHP